MPVEEIRICIFICVGISIYICISKPVKYCRADEQIGDSGHNQAQGSHILLLHISSKKLPSFQINSASSYFLKKASDPTVPSFQSALSRGSYFLKKSLRLNSALFLLKQQGLNFFLFHKSSPLTVSVTQNVTNLSDCRAKTFDNCKSENISYASLKIFPIQN